MKTEHMFITRNTVYETAKKLFTILGHPVERIQKDSVTTFWYRRIGSLWGHVCPRWFYQCATTLRAHYLYDVRYTSTSNITWNSSSEWERYILNMLADSKVQTTHWSYERSETTIQWVRLLYRWYCYMIAHYVPCICLYPWYILLLELVPMI